MGFKKHYAQSELNSLLGKLDTFPEHLFSHPFWNDPSIKRKYHDAEDEFDGALRKYEHLFTDDEIYIFESGKRAICERRFV